MKVLIYFLFNLILVYNCLATNITNNNLLFKSDFRNKFFSYLADKQLDSVNANQTCLDQLSKILPAIVEGEMWAINIIDAWGKIPSGVTQGNVMELGNFDECLKVHSPENEIQGKYCMAYIPVGIFIQNISIPNVDIKHLNLAIGICIPEVCSTEFLQKALSDFINKLLPEPVDLKIQVPSSSCTRKEAIKFRPIDIVAIIFFSLIGLIMLLSTIYDYLIQRSKRSPVPILIAFSVLTNGKKLFAIPSKSSPDVITCVHGIRCLSIMWVVLGHAYGTFQSVPMINKLDVFDWLQTSFSMLLQIATVAVDSFLFLGGFLVAWIAFKEMEKRKGKLNIPLMYFHRYVRLTPVVAVVILFSVSLLKYCASGPLWSTLLSIGISQCERNWWSTLLYVTNYATPNDMCLGHTWYLAIDVQLYVLSPLLIIPTYKWGRKFLFPTALILCILSIACNFATYMKYDFSLFIFDNSSPRNDLRLQKTYVPTHTRYSPWVVGFVCGYIMFKQRLRKIKMSKKVVLTGWFVCFALLMIIIFGTYPKTQPGAIITTVETAFFQSFHRFTWSLAIGWIVFACHNGYGGFINSFLSYPFWQVLGRLTYSIYIVHMIFQFVRFGIARSAGHFSNFEVMNAFWADFGFTLIISIVVVLAFESPILGIEKAVFGGGQKPKVVESTSSNFDARRNDIIEKIS